MRRGVAYCLFAKTFLVCVVDVRMRSKLNLPIDDFGQDGDLSRPRRMHQRRHAVWLCISKIVSVISVCKFIEYSLCTSCATCTTKKKKKKKNQMYGGEHKARTLILDVHERQALSLLLFSAGIVIRHHQIENSL